MYEPEYDPDAESYRRLRGEYCQDLDEGGRTPWERAALPHPNTELGIHCIRLLHAVYTVKRTLPSHARDSFPSDAVKLSPCLRELGLDNEIPVFDLPQWWEEVVALLEGARFLSFHKDGFWGSPREEASLDISAEGELDVIRRNARWANQLYRDAVCRRNILRWLHDFHREPAYRPELQVIMSSPWGAVEGHSFGLLEIVAARDYLQGIGLVECGSLRLTAAGISHLISGTISTGRATEKRSAVSITNNFHAGGNFQLAQGNRSVQQSQLVDGTSAADIVVLARALKEASESSVMEQVDSVELRRVSAELERVAQADEIDQERVRNLLSWARNILNQGASSALATVLASVLGGLAG